MSWLSDALAGADTRVWAGEDESGEKQSMWGTFTDDPWRALIGMDPVTTWFTNAILGRDDNPLWKFEGGATEGQQNQMIEQGIDPGPEGNVSSLVGALVGGNFLGGALGGAEGAAGAGASEGLSMGLGGDFAIGNLVGEAGASTGLTTAGVGLAQTLPATAGTGAGTGGLSMGLGDDFVIGDLAGNPGQSSSIQNPNAGFDWSEFGEDVLDQAADQASSGGPGGGSVKPFNMQRGKGGVLATGNGDVQQQQMQQRQSALIAALQAMAQQSASFNQQQPRS